jgi:Phage integrase family
MVEIKSAKVNLESIGTAPRTLAIGRNAPSPPAPVTAMCAMRRDGSHRLAAPRLKLHYLWPCDDAGLPPECTFHGLRKATLTRLADAGKTVHQIAVVSGHKTLKEVERYTRSADQRRLAREALLGEQNASASVKSDPPEVSNALNGLEKKLG